ncbi:MAG: hypothetical protein KJZ73_07560 [Pseudorhodoplanes sp.]|nr:hypothetical protein [Pseudorhodoplanes sp.]MBW7949310.1 hypothetical protein [Pseudorhodoplanes sp.]MCL4711089.1 hypothetical protein [Pseudorhodoplanes sp.]MCQ3942943.1 hypothetical protein [Alphaproteobacteria bacterium]GIK82081.1 MAG: hypothetical protein BroJett024_31860 [Alphaproteobacteria bacterium]
MEHMRRIAFETVMRACGFGFLGIICVMTGMSFDPRFAFQAGGLLTTIMAFILILKSREALTKDYRKTEMWLYIEKDFRPPEAYAQWASATVLRDTYLTFALWTSLISIVMWTFALLFSVAGIKATYSVTAPSAPHYVASKPGSTPQPEGDNPRRRPPAISYQLR